MRFNFTFESSILLIFFFHGVVFAYLLFKKSIQYRQSSSRWLGGFALLCCFYITPWMLGHAGWYSKRPYRDILFYVPTQQVFFLGPFIYFYTQSLLNKSFRFRKKDWLHFVPGFLYLVYSLVVFLTDQVILKTYYFYENQRDKDLVAWYQYTGLFSMTLYYIASIRIHQDYKKRIYQELSFADQVRFSWVRHYLWVFVLMLVIRVIFFIIYPNWGKFPQKWLYYFFFAVLFYYLTLSGYTNTIQSNIDFEPPSPPIDDQVAAKEMAEAEPEKAPEKETPASPQLDEHADFAKWKVSLVQLMQEEHLYENPLLKITDIASALDINSRWVSRLINQEFAMNFNDFVNQYRVKAVQTRMGQKDYENYTLLAIALECGFNSKTTFNRAFKKVVEMSPKAYLDQQTSQKK